TSWAVRSEPRLFARAGRDVRTVTRIDAHHARYVHFGPFIKGGLMKNKNAVDQILIRRLRAAGCPMPEDCEDDPMPGLVAVVSRPEITRVYVMRGWAEYVLALQITNHSYDCLEVGEFQCYSHWPIQVGPRICGREKPAYRLLGSRRTFP